MHWSDTILLRPETVRLMTSVQSPPDLRSRAAKNLPVQRGLGWDIHTPYRTPQHDYTLHRGAVFPVGGYGHTGWTGQMLWIDPLLAHDCDSPLQPLRRLGGGHASGGVPDASTHLHARSGGSEGN